jgi:imidazolonepropionase-like amidohydrolase
VPGAETVLHSGYLVPGLVDAHCHLSLSPTGVVTDEVEITAQAYANRDAGALLLRNPGAPVPARFLDDDPAAPRVLRAGQHLARPKRYLPHLAIELATTDPELLAAAVREQAAAGDGWVKLVGDWIDRAAGDLAPLWPLPALRAAVSAAHSVGARVAVHAFSTQALPDLIAAGVDSIEHGTGLTADLVDQLAASGAALVPTLINTANFPSIAAQATRYPVYAGHMRALHATAAQRVRAAHEAGVPI